jgi:hypothetical protein
MASVIEAAEVAHFDCADDRHQLSRSVQGRTVIGANDTSDMAGE